MAMPDEHSHLTGEMKVKARLKGYSPEAQQDIIDTIKSAIGVKMPAKNVSKQLKAKYGLRRNHTLQYYSYLQKKYDSQKEGDENASGIFVDPPSGDDDEEGTIDVVEPAWYNELDEASQQKIKAVIGDAKEYSAELSQRVMDECGLDKAQAKELLEFNFGHKVLVHRWEKEFPLEWLDDQYAVESYLGSGAFGCVGLARATVKHPFLPFRKKVAIKKMEGIFDHPVLAKRLIRELRILRVLKGHKSIVELLDVKIPKGDLTSFNEILLVFECVDSDLNAPFHDPVHYSEAQVKSMFKQMLYGLRYCHTAAIVHRDLKPQNLLMNWDKGSDDVPCVKICDFGLARSFAKRSGKASEPTVHVANKLVRKTQVDPKQLSKLGFRTVMTAHVVTRYYRAPEVSLKMQTRALSPAMDMWAMGCILGELLQMIKENQPSPLKRKVLLPGHLSTMTPSQFENADPNQVRSQMQLTCNLLGKPPASFINSIPKIELKNMMKMLPEQAPKDLSTVFPHGPSGALDLLSSLMIYDPAKRISVEDALAHPWLQDCTGIDEADLDKVLDPIEMDFEDVAMSMYTIRCLVIDELCHWIPGLMDTEMVANMKQQWEMENQNTSVPAPATNPAPSNITN